MASSKFPLSDTQSNTSSSGSCVNNNTNNTNNLVPPPPPPPPNNFNCLGCNTSFPTSAALSEHDRETGPSHAQLSRNMVDLLHGGFKPQSIVMSLPQPPQTLSIIVLPTRRGANQTTSGIALSPPATSSFLHINAAWDGTSGAGNLHYQTYNLTMRQENMPISSAAIDHGSSSLERTLDLISQLDPTQNLLSQLEQPQSAEQSGNGSNVEAVRAPRTSKGKGFVDLNLKL